jgi:hypothetical protein
MEVGNTVIPLPRTEAEPAPGFSGLRVCSDGMVREASATPVGLLDQVRADLQRRARRLRETGEAFPANPYRLAGDLLMAGTVPGDREAFPANPYRLAGDLLMAGTVPGDREAARELLARMYRDELHRALGAASVTGG